MQYLYSVQHHSRQDFLACVYDDKQNVVYEVKAGRLLQPNEMSLIETGFMSDTRDVIGLHAYLVSTGIIGRADVVNQITLH